MSERPEFREIVSCAALAAICGGAATGASFAVALAFPDLSLGLILAAVAAALMGAIMSIVTAWPLGVLIGWLVARTLGTGPRSAAIAGFVTALTMFAAALGGELLRGGFALTEAFSLGWFCLIGATSALVGYRVMIGPFSQPRPPAV